MTISKEQTSRYFDNELTNKMYNMKDVAFWKYYTTRWQTQMERLLKSMYSNEESLIKLEEKYDTLNNKGRQRVVWLQNQKDYYEEEIMSLEQFIESCAQTFEIFNVVDNENIGTTAAYLQEYLKEIKNIIDINATDINELNGVYN